MLLKTFKGVMVPLNTFRKLQLHLEQYSKGGHSLLMQFNCSAPVFQNNPEFLWDYLALVMLGSSKYTYTPISN